MDDIALAENVFAAHGAVCDGSELILRVGVGNAASHIHQGVDGFGERTLVTAGGGALDPAVDGGPVGSSHFPLLQSHGIEDGAVKTVA